VWAGGAGNGQRRPGGASGRGLAGNLGRRPAHALSPPAPAMLSAGQGTGGALRDFPKRAGPGPARRPVGRRSRRPGGAKDVRRHRSPLGSAGTRTASRRSGTGGHLFRQTDRLHRAAEIVPGGRNPRRRTNSTGQHGQNRSGRGALSNDRGRKVGPARVRGRLIGNRNRER